MGRDGRNEKRGEHFTKMLRSTMETPAWRALSLPAQAIYPWLKLEWRGPKANNNGKIRLSVRQAAERVGCNPKTAARAFHDLQAKGFIAVTEPGSLGSGAEAKGPAFEITEIELPNSKSLGGRVLFREWCEKSEFPVAKTCTNNPEGRNGKEKPCPTRGDKVVPFGGTKKQNTSP